MRLLLLIFSIIIASCAESKVSVAKGKFQAIKPPNIYGNSRYLEEGTNNSISLNANIGRNKTIPLPGVVNDAFSVGEASVSKMPANLNYRLIENTLGLQYYRITKGDDFYTGWGLGIQNFPYGVFMFGHNEKNVEIGGAIYLGLSIDKASYEGNWGYYQDGFMIDTEYDEYIRLKDLSILHTYGGINFYASYFWDKFAISYSGSISNPWLVDELPVATERSAGTERNVEEEADISFIFPFILMHDLGISYTPHNIKYRIGVNRIVGIKFPGQYWGANVEMAYLW